MQKTAAGWLAVLTAACIVAAAWPGRGALGGTLQSPGCQSGGAPATVASVDGSLALHLVDGRVVRLAGVHTDAADRFDVPQALRSSFQAWLDHATVAVAPLRGEPDRWGRTVALVFAPARTGAGGAVSVTEAALDAGLAAAQPEPGTEACWATYLELENAARQAHAGVWQGGDNPLVGAADRAGLLRRLGTWTLAGGRIGMLREGHARTYVRFEGADAGFAVAIDRATMQRLVRALGPSAQWRGRTMLARGLLDDRWGLQIDVTSPQQVSLAPP